MANSKLEFIKGETIKIPFNTPWNLTGYTVTSILKALSTTFTKTFVVTLQTNPATSMLGTILLSMTSDDLVIGELYSFDVKLVTPSGEIVKLPIVDLEVTRFITP